MSAMLGSKLLLRCVVGQFLVLHFLDLFLLVSSRESLTVRLDVFPLYMKCS